MIRTDDKTRRALQKTSDADFTLYRQSLEDLLKKTDAPMDIFLKAQIAYADKEVARRAKIAAAHALNTEGAKHLAELMDGNLSLSPLVTDILAMLLERAFSVSNASLNINANDKGGFSLSYSTPHHGSHGKSLDQVCETVHQRVAEAIQYKFKTPSPKTRVYAEEIHRLIILGHITGFYTSFHWYKNHSMGVRFGTRRRKSYSYGTPGNNVKAGILELTNLVDEVVAQVKS
jgi:hypothetical protein